MTAADDLRRLRERLDATQWLDAGERNPVTGPMRLIEPGLYERLRDALAALEHEQSATGAEMRPNCEVTHVCPHKDIVCFDKECPKLITGCKLDLQPDRDPPPPAAADLIERLARERDAAISQAISDPENQPSQFGTVTLAMYEAAREDAERLDWLEATLAKCEAMLGVKQAERDEARRLHSELLYAVARKFPGETRHQTALRYIRNAESGAAMSGCGAARASSGKDGDGKGGGE